MTSSIQKDEIDELADVFGGWENLARALHGALTSKPLSDEQLAALGVQRVTDQDILELLNPLFENTKLLAGKSKKGRPDEFGRWLELDAAFRECRPASVNNTDALSKIIQRQGRALGFSGKPGKLKAEIKTAANRLADLEKSKPDWVRNSEGGNVSDIDVADVPGK
jgi:hypothetical protein